MHIKLSFSYVLTFLLLLIVLLELHETVHIVVGYFICGCWGPRDFNVWSLCKGCPENHPLWWVATLAGPLASFALMWLGMIWLSAKPSNKTLLGFSLVFANIPFGRISNVMMGGGDEMVVTRHFLKADYSRTQMILICSVLVLCLGLPPIIKAYKVLTNRRAWLYLLGFLTLPLLFLLIYVLTGLNSLLTRGFLATPWIMGTPVLITLHTSIALVGLIWLRKNLFKSTKNLRI
ncbi:hypothetical protein GO755_25630 [Spirosoma sp. HMF4905]|uniref:Uncharacterized protein n=1 Tax=Spirosoma arboris TaxID=2682092 RepID=A0A7K1SI52_9BACT|nr:hypothetical protein [Spirosoma arboris]MVM33443.1 hypothetical protein [Spirosoma arboris]